MNKYPFKLVGYQNKFLGAIEQTNKTENFVALPSAPPANETDASFSELSHSSVSQGMAHNDNNLKQMGTDSTVYCYFDQ